MKCAFRAVIGILALIGLALVLLIASAALGLGRFECVDTQPRQEAPAGRSILLDPLAING